MSHGFFRVLSTREFRTRLLSFDRLERLRFALAEAQGLYLAADVVAGEDLPPAHRSGMDGYAVAAADLFGASEGNPGYVECVAEVAIERAPEITLEPGQCAAITTGGVLPRGADAVVMVEYAEAMAGGTVEVRKSVAPGENVMLQGEDARRGETALAAGTKLRPQEIGLLAALGVVEVEAVRPARAAVISTGDELVEITQPAGPGKVRDVNSYTLAAQIAAAGFVPLSLGLVQDDLAAITAALEQGLAQADAIFVSGGSSVGMRDMTLEAVSRLPDAEVLAHGVQVSPGKPTILARAGGKPVWGLPGQVTSAQVVMHVFGLPFLRHLSGGTDVFSLRRVPQRRAELARNLASRQGREDYVRVSLAEREGELPLAAPRLGKSGLLKTLIAADGLVCIGHDREGLGAGHLVDVMLL